MPLRSRVRLLVATAVAGVLLLGAILFSIKNQYGEIVVSVDGLSEEEQKQIEIKVSGNGETKIANKTSGWTIDIKKGTYDVELTGGSDRVQVKDKQVTVSRKDKATVTVTLKPLDASDSKTNTVPSADHDADPDRQLAQWLKTLPPPAMFYVSRSNGPDFLVDSNQVLPDEPFRVYFPFLQGPAFDQSGNALVEEFAKRAKGTRLGALHLSSPTLTSERVVQYVQIPDLSHLKDVAITGELVDDRAIAALAGLKELKGVNFRCPKLTGRGLSQLREMTSLALLEGSSFSAEGFDELAQLPNFIALQIGGFRYTERHVEALAKLKLTNLQTWDAGIDDAMLPRLTRMETLEYLSVGNSPITDASLPELKKLKNLTGLDLKETKLTAAGIADLQKALPNCKIEWETPKAQ